MVKKWGAFQRLPDMRSLLVGQPWRPIFNSFDAICCASHFWKVPKEVIQKCQCFRASSPGFAPSGPFKNTPCTAKWHGNGQEQVSRIAAPTAASFRPLCPNGAVQQSPRLAAPQHRANPERVAHRPQPSLPNISIIPFKGTPANAGPFFTEQPGTLAMLLPVQPFPETQNCTCHSTGPEFWRSKEMVRTRLFRTACAEPVETDDCTTL